jgi:hypothetical protein
MYEIFVNVTNFSALCMLSLMLQKIIHIHNNSLLEIFHTSGFLIQNVEQVHLQTF